MERSLPEGLTIRLDSMVLDCLSGHDLARFYERLLGWPICYDKPEFSAVKSPEGLYVFFQTEPDYEPPVWPTQKGSPQMMAHLDFHVNDLDAAVAHALDCGATLSPVQYLNDVRILLDPSGHPFCLCG